MHRSASGMYSIVPNLGATLFFPLPQPHLPIIAFAALHIFALQLAYAMLQTGELRLGSVWYYSNKVGRRARLAPLERRHCKGRTGRELPMTQHIPKARAIKKKHCRCQKTTCLSIILKRDRFRSANSCILAHNVPCPYCYNFIILLNWRAQDETSPLIGSCRYSHPR